MKANCHGIATSLAGQQARLILLAITKLHLAMAGFPPTLLIASYHYICIAGRLCHVTVLVEARRGDSYRALFEPRIVHIQALAPKESYLTVQRTGDHYAWHSMRICLPLCSKRMPTGHKKGHRAGEIVVHTRRPVCHQHFSFLQI